MAEYVDTVQARRRRRPGPLVRSDERSFVARLDWVLLAATCALVAFGLWAISGITQHDVPGEPRYFLTRQLVFAAIGAVLMVAAVFVDPAWYRRWKPAIYSVMIGLMVLVALVGTVARGSRRWIDVSIFRFQPSEFGKLLFVLFIAAFLADRIRRIEDVRTPLLAIALAMPPVLLVFLQPDLGSGLVYLAA
ncbi:MAG: FtsW/RodA/SpoVE family cell cycle protein, partial [Gaiellaceae bacterium]